MRISDWSSDVCSSDLLLRMVGRDSDVSLRATHHPEFDAWRWSQYWVPLDAVIEFKRDVYTLALNELATVLFRRGSETRYLRQRVQNPRSINRLSGKNHARPAGWSAGLSRARALWKSDAARLRGPAASVTPPQLPTRRSEEH